MESESGLIIFCNIFLPQLIAILIWRSSKNFSVITLNFNVN